VRLASSKPDLSSHFLLKGPKNEPRPSSCVLVSLGFEHVDDREDPDLGTVSEWRWSRPLAR